MITIYCSTCGESARQCVCAEPTLRRVDPLYNITTQVRYRCPMETAFGHGGPTRYCNLPLRPGFGVCDDHVQEYGEEYARRRFANRPGRVFSNLSSFNNAPLRNLRLISGDDAQYDEAASTLYAVALFVWAYFPDSFDPSWGMTFAGAYKSGAPLSDVELTDSDLGMLFDAQPTAQELVLAARTLIRYVGLLESAGLKYD